MSEWFEDESFWIEMRPFIFPEERVRIAEQQVEKILTLAGYQGGPSWICVVAWGFTPWRSRNAASR
jgi:hypothetical protein